MTLHTPALVDLLKSYKIFVFLTIDQAVHLSIPGKILMLPSYPALNMDEEQLSLVGYGTIRLLPTRQLLSPTGDLTALVIHDCRHTKHLIKIKLLYANKPTCPQWHSFTMHVTVTGLLLGL